MGKSADCAMIHDTISLERTILETIPVARAMGIGKNGNGASRATMAHSISCGSSSTFPQ